MSSAIGQREHSKSKLPSPSEIAQRRRDNLEVGDSTPAANRVWGALVFGFCLWMRGLGRVGGGGSQDYDDETHLSVSPNAEASRPDSSIDGKLIVPRWGSPVRFTRRARLFALSPN